VRRVLACAYALAAVALLLWLFAKSPVVGLASNGDFPKICGKFCLGPPHGWADNQFLYFVSDYEISQRYCWQSGLTSSETPLAGLAVGLNRLFYSPSRFDIRALGLVHSLIFFASFCALLEYCLRRSWPVMIVLPLLVLLVFLDIEYSAYFHTFYMDAAAYVFLLATIVAALWATDRNGSLWPALSVLVCGTLLLLSKSQHAPAGVGLVLFALAMAAWQTAPWRRIAWTGIALMFLGTAILMVRRVPTDYRAISVFNTVFSKLPYHVTAPAQMLVEVGLTPDDARWIGMNAFSPGSPIPDYQSQLAFGRRARMG
jgi:hypothetical protein